MSDATRHGARQPSTRKRVVVHFHAEAVLHAIGEVYPPGSVAAATLVDGQIRLDDHSIVLDPAAGEDAIWTYREVSS